jgi:hypothetical protein
MAWRERRPALSVEPMFPSVFLPAVISQINRLDDAERRLAEAPRLTAAERQRRAGHLARLRRRLRWSTTAPTFPPSAS